MITEDEIDVIIPAAGMGRRMKSYGPKSLIKIGNSTIIKNQISLLRSYLSNPNIVLVCGFKATLLMNQTPHDIIKVENEKYTETNVARSIGIGLRIVSNSKKLVVIYGDLVFNSRGFNKNYDTNTIETVLINDLTFSSFPKINNKWNGLQTNYKLLLRNLNSKAEDSNEFKENENQELLSTFVFETDLPLKKESKNFSSFLTPKMSFRYSSFPSRKL